MRMCEICWTMTKDNYCSKKCAKTGWERGNMFSILTFTQQKKYLNRHRETIFAAENEEGEPL